MHLDILEVRRISGLLGSLETRHKLLVSYIAAKAADSVICSEMGLKPHQIQAAVTELCGELQMSHLEKSGWREYIYAAVLLIVGPSEKTVSKPVFTPKPVR